MSQQIVIVGVGALAREAAWIVAECPGCGLAAFVSDLPHPPASLLGLPVFSPAEARRRFPEARALIALGDPQARKAQAQSLSALGFAFATAIHPRAAVSPRAVVGEGSILFPCCVLSTEVVLGRHVVLNPNCTLSHDVTLGDFATLGPGVSVAGRVSIGEAAQLGVGVSVKNGLPEAFLDIGAGAVVGAGACVVDSIPAGQTWAGVPARPLRCGDAG